MRYLISIMMLALLVPSVYADRNKEFENLAPENVIDSLRAQATIDLLQKQEKGAYIALIICPAQMAEFTTSKKVVTKVYLSEMTIKDFTTNLLLSIKGDKKEYMYMLTAAVDRDGGKTALYEVPEIFLDAYRSTNPIFNFTLSKFGDDPMRISIGELDKGSYELEGCQVRDPGKYYKN